MRVTIPEIQACFIRWRHGCLPTALAVIHWYWYRRGYTNLMDADTLGAAQRMCASTAHYNDYSLPKDSRGSIKPDKSTLGAAHEDNCVADHCKTSFSSRSNPYGWSWFSDADEGLEDYAIARGYEDAESFSESWGALTFQDVKDEIDAGRPMCFLVDSSGADGWTDHFVTVVGYDDTDPANPKYGCMDTWGGGIHWHNFKQIAQGVSWGVYGATYFDPGPLPELEPNPEPEPEPMPDDLEYGLIARWPLFVNALDVVGVRDGVTENMTFANAAANFDGATAKIALNDNDPVWLPAGDFSFAVRVKVRLLGTTQYIFDANHGDSSTPGNELGYCLRINGDGRVAFNLTTEENTDEDLVGPALVAETWYHLVIVREGRTQRLYVIDGGLPIAAGWKRDCSAEPVRFVGNYDNNHVSLGAFSRAGRGSKGPIFFFNGLMSDARLYDRALTAEEVTLLAGLPTVPTPEPDPEPESVLEVTLKGAQTVDAPIAVVTNDDGSVTIKFLKQ